MAGCSSGVMCCRCNPSLRVGAELLAAVADLRPVAPIVRQHHERYDGAGYPDGLAENEILLEARIITATNAWSAMTSDRPDRLALTPDAALLELERVAGTKLDPRVVDALKRVLADQPPTGPVDAT